MKFDCDASDFGRTLNVARLVLRAVKIVTLSHFSDSIPAKLISKSHPKSE